MTSIYERRNKYRAENSEKIIEYRKFHYEIHRQQIIECSKQWARENPEKRKAAGRKYYNTHRDIVLLKQKDRFESNPELKAKKKERDRKWNKKNPESARERSARRQALIADCEINDLTDQQIREILTTGQCANCGRIDKMHLDHIIPISRGGNNTKDNCQALCGPCNLTKHAKILQDGAQLILNEFFNPKTKVS